MNISINGRNLDVTSRLQSYIERKVGRLDRFMPNIHEIRVDLSEEKSNRAGNRIVAQITVRHTRGTILRAEQRTNDIFAAVDEVVDRIYRQIERYKGKRRRRGDETEDYSSFETAVELDEDDLDIHQIVRRKQYSIAPMDEEEAIEQLELLGHNFYVFVNAGTSLVNVLYSRNDGSYGLLEPEAKI
jgi:putative sigma-54 modulation protein